MIKIGPSSEGNPYPVSRVGLPEEPVEGWWNPGRWKYHPVTGERTRYEDPQCRLADGSVYEFIYKLKRWCAWEQTGKVPARVGDV